MESKMSEWQPIETAPKDGTPILVYRPAASGVGYIQKVSGDYAMLHKSGKWVWACSNDAAQPTHWMPLPELPK